MTGRNQCALASLKLIKKVRTASQKRKKNTKPSQLINQKLNNPGSLLRHWSRVRLLIECSLIDEGLVFTLLLLAYQLMLLHRSIRINIKIRLIDIIIYSHPLSSIKYFNTCSKIYIYPCMFNIYLIEPFVCESVFLCLPSFMNILWHILYRG